MDKKGGHYSPHQASDVDLQSSNHQSDKQGQTCDSVTEAKQEYSTIFVFTEPQPTNESADNMTTLQWEPRKPRLFYETALEPFHVSLRLFGLMYHVDGNRRCNVAKWYHRLVVMLIWLNFLRYFGAYDLGEPFGFMLTTKIAIHGTIFWGISGVAAATIMAKQRPVIFNAWYKYKRDFNPNVSSLEQKSIRKRVYITLLVSWSLFAVTTAIFIFAYWHDQVVFILRLGLLPFAGLCDEQFHNIFSFIFILFVNVFNMSICGFQLGYLLLFVKGLEDEFAKFNADFKNCITPNTARKDYIDLEHWRKQHLELSKLADLVDSGFGLHILLLFLTNIGVCSFLVYMTILILGHGVDNEGMATMLAIYLVYLALSVGIIFIITYAGTNLNTQVIIFAIIF